MTRHIVEAGKLLDIDVLDHLVIGQQRWVSLKESGLGFWVARCLTGAENNSQRRSGPMHTREVYHLDETARQQLSSALRQMNVNARAYRRILKPARS